MKRILLAVLLLAATSGALAQQFTFTNLGEPDCGKWLNQRSDTHKAWLHGVLTGQNIVFAELMKGNPLGKLSSAEQAYAWMDNYCRSNPLKGLSEGAYELFVELIKK